jgi:RimJ/RimL family protein N-acetyltransferase
LNSFTTDRLLAEHLTAEHLPRLRLMDRNEPFMAKLGGVRDEAGTIRYLEANPAHWAEYGFGLWMLRERESGTLIGRAVLRHLDIECTGEVETGYGFLPQYLGKRPCHRGWGLPHALYRSVSLSA